MAVLKNARHERFAQEVAKGKSATEAYELAGYKPDRKNAARLTTNDGIARRVTELQSKVAEKAEWTAADRLAALKRISDASEKNDPRVAVSAISEANKMQGSHAPAKSELTGKNGGPVQIVDLTNVSDEQLAALEAIFGPLAGSSDDDASDPGGEGEAGS